MTSQNANPVRTAAEQDYRPDLVRVNEAAIKARAIPSKLAVLGSTLGTSPLARAAHTFVPYFMVMDAINFQFWDVDCHGTFQRYSHNGKVGDLLTGSCEISLLTKMKKALNDKSYNRPSTKIRRNTSCF